MAGMMSWDDVEHAIAWKMRVRNKHKRELYAANFKGMLSTPSHQRSFQGAFARYVLVACPNTVYKVGFQTTHSRMAEN